MEWYLKVIKQYADFEGRARRKEYWMFVLFNMIISIVISAIEFALGVEFLSWLYSLAILIPSLSVGARRLHDIGKSGWMQLLILLPVIGWIWLLVLHITEGNYGDNEYGGNPKEEFEY